MTKTVNHKIKPYIIAIAITLGLFLIYLYAYKN